MENKQLELRMYFFVPYNISPIQQAIQAGHSALKYARKFYDKNDLIWDFIDEHGAWIILNGGTTNDRRDFDGVLQGSLNQIADQLSDNDIDFSYFEEQDLNDALTAVCFIADERVWNYEDYLDLPEYLASLSLEVHKDLGKGQHEIHTLPLIAFKIMTKEEIQEKYPKEYEDWVELLGGKKNVFLRELIKGKKLA